MAKQPYVSPTQRKFDELPKHMQEEAEKEELVAEIGAAVLCNEMKLETADSFKNSAAYIE